MLAHQTTAGNTHDWLETLIVIFFHIFKIGLRVEHCHSTLKSNFLCHFFCEKFFENGYVIAMLNFCQTEFLLRGLVELELYLEIHILCHENSLAVSSYQMIAQCHRICIYKTNRQYLKLSYIATLTINKTAIILFRPVYYSILTHTALMTAKTRKS